MVEGESKMAEKIEAFFEYIMEHPAVLMIVGGMFFAFISIFTASVNDQTTTFLELYLLG
jgi:hypothetical protein